MTIFVQRIDYHSNGGSGEGFYAVLFIDREAEGGIKVAIVFAEPGRVAVLDIGLLGKGDSGFGPNTWPGGRYEAALRRSIDAFLNR